MSIKEAITSPSAWPIFFIRIRAVTKLAMIGAKKSIMETEYLVPSISRIKLDPDRRLQEAAGSA